MGARRRGASVGAVGAAAIAVVLGGCDPWRCAFESHGACIEFPRPPDDLGAAKARVDRLLALELPYWGLSSLAGWRIQFRHSVRYPCYLTDRDEGCTDYLEKTISVRLPPEAPECFEASELFHELGHHALGDPIHSAPRWRGVPDQFAGIVWDRWDAPTPCLIRYGGIRQGMWSVNLNGF